MGNRRKPRATTEGSINGSGVLHTPAGTQMRVPERWADEPRPSLQEKVMAYVVGLTDSREGRDHNAYVCGTCGAAFHTIDAHPGVTPSSLSHATLQPGTRCEGRCVSQGYPAGAIPTSLGEPSHEWYRPSTTELDGCSPQVADHVRRGGLLLRRAGERRG